MFDLIAIQDVIADAVALANTDVVDFEVIIANQNAPRPDTNYASVYITPARKLGMDRVTLANDALEDLDETIEGHREFRASINFFKDGALINASSFETQLQGNKLMDHFKSNGLGISTVSDIRDLSEINKELWEERAQMDLTFYALTNFTETVLAIKVGRVDGVTQSGNRETNININVEIN